MLYSFSIFSACVNSLFDGHCSWKNCYLFNDARKLIYMLRFPVIYFLIVLGIIPTKTELYQVSVMFRF